MYTKSHKIYSVIKIYEKSNKKVIKNMYNAIQIKNIMNNTIMLCYINKRYKYYNVYRTNVLSIIKIL